MINSSGIMMLIMLFLMIYLVISVAGYLICIQIIAKNLAMFGVSHIVTKRVTEGLIWGLFLLFFFYYVDNIFIVLGLLPALFIAITSDVIFRKLSVLSDKQIGWMKIFIWMSCVIFVSVILSYLFGHFLSLQDLIPSELLSELRVNREIVPILYAFSAGFMGFIVCLTLLICQECRLRFCFCLLDDFFREF